MSTRFPATGIDDSSTLPNPATNNFQNSPSHAGLHGNANDAIKAVETKLGTGATTPASATLLIGTGAGTSAWSALTSSQLAGLLSDETGTGSAVFAATPTLVTPKVDTINEATVGNGTTIGGVNIKSGFINGSNITPATVGSSQLVTGVPVQIVATNYSAVATGTTIIPNDDTIPQITEGVEFMTQAIIPKSGTNRLFIEAEFNLSISSNGQIIGAIFQDATANALAARSMYNGNFVNNMFILRVTHDMPASTTSSTTFRLRAGSEVAGTWTFNGVSGARKFGGITLSSIKITEYKV